MGRVLCILFGFLPSVWLCLPCDKATFSTVQLRPAARLNTSKDWR